MGIVMAAVLVPALLLALAAKVAMAEGYKRDVVKYKVPEVVLTSQDGEDLSLPALLEKDKPVMVNFIYATCTTICPVLSAGFANFQRKLGDESEDVYLASITIDPEYDSPEVMKEYLERYRARPGWDFLTGSREDIDSVMKAFDAYVSNKMNHYPLIFLKAPGSGSWVRLDGLMGTSELIAEYRKLR
jgi:protein SCO1/2